MMDDRAEIPHPTFGGVYLDERRIAEALLVERPDAVDQRYLDCKAWDRGACDEWNTVTLRFGELLFPAREDVKNIRRKRYWLDELRDGREPDMEAFELSFLEPDVPF